MSWHADAVLAAMEAKDDTSLIATSWRRSALRHRLDPDETHTPDRDTRALREARERDAMLVARARPHLERLFDALDDPLGGATLVDARGLMMDVRFGTTQDVEDVKLARWLGADVSEAAIGTNGNGTCLAEERPVIVSRDDHFLSMLTHTICVAAPIFGPEGQLLGAINALTRSSSPLLERLLQVVTQDCAQRIELELFAAAYPGAQLTLASSSNQAALLAVDRDRMVVGATRTARRLLELEPETLRHGIDLRGLRGDAPSETIAEAERTLVTRVLARHAGNVTRAARELGITRATLHRKAIGLPRRV